MPRSRSKRSDPSHAAAQAGPRASTGGSGLMELALGLTDGLGDASDLDPDAVFGPLAVAAPEAGGEAEPEAAAEPTVAPATPLPEVPDLAGGLLAEMQGRFEELQKWADASTSDLVARRERIAVAEADLAARRDALVAEEQKTAHDRERFARYRSAETEKLVAAAAEAERQAAETVAEAERDARILIESADAQAAEQAKERETAATERIAEQRAAALADADAHRQDVEADLQREREALETERANLARERQRLDEAKAEAAKTQEDLDTEWQSVLRLQRSTESLVKAWEADRERRRGGQAPAASDAPDLRFRGAPAADLGPLGSGADADLSDHRLAA
ncbi:coiled-coil domain-containing protein [Phycisphaera mikurensis]|uniref:Uncharacterized protein n=1 Tax=Phycisphaera mikurensis (strain NBRC 102666 / KCTC 22515 / FYK2301M01) TaxID=1142394 RepID=I0IIG3_PHYMF|nr:hypothetical protein [Phycisphaera mikurensis]MBB6442793.1 hypothetical protein [Phycisphaera mikurensis]BAM05051.1 hypothetical protein PSMK_28920 [Phycisphaera mikurensis NBRC 102666]